MEYTSYMMITSYLIENLLLEKRDKSYIESYLNGIEEINQEKNELPMPAGLEFLDMKHDYATGMTAVAFREKATNKVLIGFTGTNLTNDKNADLYTDVIGIGFGQGGHYQSAYRFYNKVAAKYGKPAVVTGHSLGGNYAQRVALKFNIPKAVVYNSAPLYLDLDKLEIFQHYMLFFFFCTFLTSGERSTPLL